jgi:hypothetical protein
MMVTIRAAPRVPTSISSHSPASADQATVPGATMIVR